MQTGLVTTIIPVHNRPHMLREAVNSVVQQDYRPLQVIIVDDGSTDNTLDTANNLAAQHDFIKVLSISNSGPGGAREAGRQIAEGEFIQYLDSDDLLHDTKFSLQVTALRNAPEAAACYCKTSIQLVHESKEIPSWKRTGEKIDTILPAMLAERWWGTSTALYRRSACDAAGPWREFINEEDWEYDCRIGRANNNLCRVDVTLSVERQHEAPRLSRGGTTDPDKLTARTQAHLAVIGHAIAAAYDHRTAEFSHLLVDCFFLSRQCAEAGLSEQSESLLLACKKHMATNSRHLTKVRLYHIGSRLLGWQTMGKLAGLVDKVRA